MAARTNKLKVLLSVGSATLGEYNLRTEPIDGGYRLTITRGSEVQTLDVMDGVGIAGIEKTASVGLTDVYTITLTDGSSYDFTVTNGTGGGSGGDVPIASETVAGIIRVGENLSISADGTLSVNTDTIVDDVLAELPIYGGAYLVRPDFEEQTLATKGYTMANDVTVGAIQVSKIGNLSGGNTVYIGGVIENE